MASVVIITIELCLQTYSAFAAIHNARRAFCNATLLNIMQIFRLHSLKSGNIDRCVFIGC